MHRLKKLLMLIIFLLSLQIVTAGHFSIQLVKIDDRIIYDTNDFASFNITIDNKENEITRFKIYTLESIDWEVDAVPSTGNIIKAYPEKINHYLVKIRPIKKGLGTYKMILNVRSEETDEKVTFELALSVVSSKGLFREYIPDIRIWVDMETTNIDPRKKVGLTVTLKNENPRNIEELNIDLESRLIDQRSTISLGPLEEKAVDFTLSFNPLELPKKDVLSVRVWTLVGNQSYPKKQPEPIQYEIVAYSAIDRKEDETEGFLKTQKIITLSNRGNAREEITVKIETNPFVKLFTSTQPRAEILKEGGKRYLIWKVVLDSEKENKVDTKTVIMVKNYRPLFFMIILAIIGFVGYYFLRSPIVIQKTARKTSTSEEGGISGLKTTIHIKNRSKNTIEKIRIIDKIPNITELEKEFQIGTLKPSHIVKGRSLTSIKWDIPALEPLEERIITYKITSKLSVVGEMRLHPTVAKFRDEKGKEVIIHSNRFILR